MDKSTSSHRADLIELIARSEWLSKAERTLIFVALSFMSDEEICAYSDSVKREAKLRGAYESQVR